MRVQAAPSEHWGWMTARSSYVPGSGFTAIECVDASGAIAGMVGFDGWTPAAVWMHVAIDRPAACRGLLRAAFWYVFVQCARLVAFGAQPADNVGAARLAKRLGFHETHRLRDGWAPGVDMVLVSMRREECRWLEGMHA